MQTAKISGLGKAGLSLDNPQWSIPPNALSAGQNVRAFHGRLRNFGGRELNTTAPIEPYSLFGIQTPDRETLWVEAGLTAVYVYDGTNHIDISRASGAYALNEYTDRWTGGVQGTLVALCPGDAGGPQQWHPINTTTLLVDMMYDPTATPGSQTWQELAYTAYAMRTYKNVILAMNLTRSSARFPATIQWSEAIAPGATQVDWVPRTTNIAGEQPLGETSGNIIDGARLRDDFIIYKEDSAFRMSLGGPNIFIFDKLPDYVRIINRNCIGVADEFHVLASRDDVQVFDGNVFRSIFDKKVREFYQSSMFPERLFTTFVSVLGKENEAWVCLPKSDADPASTKHPDMAIVWNYKDDTISITDIPECRDMDQGVIVPDIPDTFDSILPADLTFDQDTLRFDQSPFSTALDFLVGAHGASLSVFGEQPTDDGKPRECIAERTGIVLKDEKSGMLSTDGVHRIREVRPYIDSTMPIQVQVGAQMAPNDSVAWEPEQTFNPAVDHHLKFRATGRYFGYRIRSNAAVNWEATALEFDYHRVRRQ